MKIDAVIVAAGCGKRMGFEGNKAFMPILGKEMLLYTLGAFSDNKNISDIIVVTGEKDLTVCEDLIKAHGLFKVKKVMAGGATRQESVYIGICGTGCDYVCIHDGARALVENNVIDSAIAAAIKYGAAAPAIKICDTLKLTDSSGFICETVDRERAVRIQTPQVFLRDEIKKCHEMAKKDGLAVTDDCALFEHYGNRVMTTEGSMTNIKLTIREDVVAAERILKERGICG